jgi:hypothetical protein
MSAESLSSELDVWVETHATRLVDEWRACCAVPSVSAEGPEAVAEMAAWLTDYAAALFDRFESMQAPGSAPVLLGTLDGSGPGRCARGRRLDPGTIRRGAGGRRGLRARRRG